MIRYLARFLLVGIFYALLVVASAFFWLAFKIDKETAAELILGVYERIMEESSVAANDES